MMKSIQLSAPFSGGATLIPNTFFDIFMPDANGEFVKVYLYLMRYFQSGCLNLSVLKTADTLHLTDGDVERALKYWASKGLLAISSDPSGNITNICLSGTGQDRLQNMGPVSPIPAPGGEKTGADDKPSSPVPGAREAGEDLLGSSRGQELVMVIEQYLGHPLSSMDVEKISYFHNQLGFSFELIDYLADYCATRGKTDMKYLERVAQNWAGSGITTVSQAREEAQMHEASTHAVMTELGLSGRSPAPVEMESIRRWLYDYGFSLDMVRDACRRTIKKIQKPDFAYVDGILSRWKAEGISTPEQALEDDRQHSQKMDEQKKQKRERGGGKNKVQRGPSNRFNNFPQRSYDFKELEKQLVNKSRQDPGQGSGGD